MLRIFLSLLFAILFSSSGNSSSLKSLLGPSFLKLNQKSIQRSLFFKRSFSTLSEKDWERLDLLMDSKLEKLKNQGEWDLPYAKRMVIKELESQGQSSENAEVLFKNLDASVDKKRDQMNLPFKIGLGSTLLAIPATWSIVYIPNFYNAVLDRWPWLENTSWDWSEPLVQSALTTETGLAIFAGCFTALGYRPYMKWRDEKLTAHLQKESGIPYRVAKKFIKVDK